MSGEIPRVRMFAGPNGSGKSALKLHLPSKLQGVYINPDDIEAGIRSRGFLDFSDFGIETTGDEVISFFEKSEFLKQGGLGESAPRLYFSGGRLNFTGGTINSYFASAAAEYLRIKLLDQKRSFTFETVMSHPGKVALLEEAQRAGWRTYLYYVATSDPQINIARVRTRVGLGGHGVPEEKIVSRYHRSLALLMDAIRCTNRAYIFDNSTDSADRTHTWVAEITDGRVLDLKTSPVPSWFKHAVLDKIS